MPYKIISVGPKFDPLLKASIETYEKRLDAGHVVTWQLLPYSSSDMSVARRAESDSVRQKLTSSDYVVLLDEQGVQTDSEGFAEFLQSQQNLSKQVVFVIGGAYGVDDELRARADKIWSLSKLVFPHQLVRLLLIEQIYRAQAIQTNHPYHHA